MEDFTRNQRGETISVPEGTLRCEAAALKYPLRFVSTGATGTESRGPEFTLRINVRGLTKLDPACMKTSTAGVCVINVCPVWPGRRPV